jgi:hypothetical protein
VSYNAEVLAVQHIHTFIVIIVEARSVLQCHSNETKIVYTCNILMLKYIIVTVYVPGMYS